MSSKPFMTEQETSDYLAEMGVERKPKTLRKHRISGTEIPFVRFGRDIRYRKKDIDAWLNAAPVMQSTSSK